MLFKIRKKLTILYTGVFGLFLLAFIGIVCAGLLWGVYVERTEEIKLLTHQIAREQWAVLLQRSKETSFVPQEMSNQDNYDISGQVFYYVLDATGKLVKADLPVPVLREAAYAMVKNWPVEQATQIASVNLPTGSKAMLVMAAKSLYHRGTLLGTVYVGRDITAYSQMLVRSIITVAGAAILFLLVAAIIGYYLAGKVTIPIEQSIKRQKQFVADASHELRNPLSVLLTSIEAIEMDHESSLSSFARKIMDDAKEEFSRLKRLVNDLLLLARADSEDIRLRKEHFLLELVAGQVIRSLQTVAAQKQIMVQLVSDQSIEVYADPERIHQLLYILIDNSLKYSLPHSKVVVQLEHTKNAAAPYVKIVVEDTGVGIPAELQRQIFQRFFRVDESRSRDIEGAGLGLSIAQWIVDAHHGGISVKSELGKGSRFIVLIPKS